MLSILPSAARQGAELEGLGAAREAEREGKAQHGGRWSLEGELLQQGSEEDEELSPGQLLTRTGTLAWKRSKENHAQSRAEFKHHPGEVGRVLCKGIGGLAGAMGHREGQCLQMKGTGLGYLQRQGSSHPCCIAKAAGAFLPSKVRWQCSPTHRAEGVPRSSQLSREMQPFRAAKGGGGGPQK